MNDELVGLPVLREFAGRGQALMEELSSYIRDAGSSPAQLKKMNGEISELDRDIEELGLTHGPLGPLARMFVFSKENLQGSDALELASQMKSIYQDLERRCQKFSAYYTSAR
jgi:SMC interacting uncharacterized protein involved in chromosome segregation